MWSAKAETHLANACSEISRIVDGASGRIVCPVWGEDGVISASVFFERGGTVVFKFPSKALNKELFSLWDACAAEQEPWRLLTIAMVSGKFSASARYPEHVGEMHAELDPAGIVKEHFGADVWDDTTPEVDEPRQEKRV